MRILAVTWLAVYAGAAATAPVSVVKQLDVPMKMRDGVDLYANVYRPSEPARLPTLMVRTAYGKGSGMNSLYEMFVRRGYAVVVQDVRGRYESEGVFKPLQQEGRDGDDSLNWIARQPWSDGKIGMFGGSYLGIVQWKAALTGNPHLKAIFPVVSGYDDYRDRFYSTGGALKLGNRLLWMSENLRLLDFKPEFNLFVRHLPLATSDRAATGQTSEMYQEAMAHPAFDSFWRGISTREKLDKIKIPVFSVGGWYDNFVQSDLEAFVALRKTTGLNRIIVGPWPHNMSTPFANVNYGKDAAVPVRSYQIDWFEQWLKRKGAALAPSPPLRIFVMGANRWREAQEWPPAGVRFVPYYLTSYKRANSAAGDGGLSTRPPGVQPPDRYVYDPRNPAPTKGGAVCCNPKIFAWGPMDQRNVESRQDVLVYTSRALRRDLEVTGPIKVVLFVATSARDTDFTAKLVDVFPGGEARNLTDGILRMRYRNTLEKAEPANPGEMYRVMIDAGVTSNMFLKGHRIRVEISSSNFPRFDRNPNTGGPIGTETKLLKATQTVYHSAKNASYVLLPIMP